MIRSNWLLALGLGLTALGFAVSADGQVVCYVEHHRFDDSGDGFSWGTAKKTIQAAVDISAPSLCDQIWVAEGTYVLTNPLVIDFRSSDIYGGFEVGDFQLSQRDWVANETIIDGNDAVEHVIVIQNQAFPIIDGFTITGGTYWDSNLDEGGGFHITHCGGSRPEIRNNFIHGNGNPLYGHGGGIYVWNCSPVISNNIFQDNTTKYNGHAIDLETSAASVTNNTFIGNFSLDNTTGSPWISNNIFWSDTDNSKITNDGSTLIVQNNIVRQPGYGDGGGGPDTNGNINADPMLFGFRPHLRAGSPAIDAGTNAAPDLPDEDFEGDPRIVDGDENGTATVDIGADEFEPGQTFGIWYVNGGVATTGSGTSWSDPMKTIHEALASAVDGEEIWVKAGVYPFTTSATAGGLAVGIYGGFTGGETQREQRDPIANPTVLDGQGTSGTLSVGTVTVDGFTFTGSTSHSGGSMVNCIFAANPGSLSVALGNTVRSCRFENNTGGAVFGPGTIEDSVFIGNTHSAGSGAAISAGNGTVVDRSIFLNNSSGVRGGAIYVGSGGNLEVRNSLFVGNHAGAADNYEGGGAIFTYSAPITVIGSTFYGNYAENGGMGGAIGSYFNSTTYTVTNSIFKNNADDQGGWSKNFRGDPTVTYSCLDETMAGTGNKNADPSFIDPDGADNTLGTEDDDFRLGASSPATDAGNNTGIPICSTDLDGGQRFLDDPDVADTGNGSAPITDMGAYERGGSATEYTLTLAATGSGTTDPAVGTHVYPVCSQVEVSATPAGGWGFVDWTGAVADPGSPTTSVTMLGDRTATANFFVLSVFADGFESGDMSAWTEVFP